MLLAPLRFLHCFAAEWMGRRCELLEGFSVTPEPKQIQSNVHLSHLRLSSFLLPSRAASPFPCQAMQLQAAMRLKNSFSSQFCQPSWPGSMTSSPQAQRNPCPFSTEPCPRTELHQDTEERSPEERFCTPSSFFADGEQEGECLVPAARVEMLRLPRRRAARKPRPLRATGPGPSAAGEGQGTSKGNCGRESFGEFGAGLMLHDEQLHKTSSLSQRHQRPLAALAPCPRQQPASNCKSLQENTRARNHDSSATVTVPLPTGSQCCKALKDRKSVV